MEKDLARNLQIGILQGRLTPSNGRGIQFFPDNEWEKEFETARTIGFSCIELLIKEQGYSANPLFTKLGVERIMTLKKEHSIETLSIHGFYSLESWYPDVYCELIKTAAHLGAKVVLVSFFGNKTLHTELDKSRARTQLARPIQCAEEHGISIAVEAEIVATELKQFIESFNSPSIGIYYDIGNMASMNIDLRADILTLGPLIKGVHIKDRKRDGGESVRLGTGDADFDAAFDALRLIGYNGPYIIQGARDTDIDDITLNTNYLTFTSKRIT